MLETRGHDAGARISAHDGAAGYVRRLVHPRIVGSSPRRRRPDNGGAGRACDFDRLLCEILRHAQFIVTDVKGQPLWSVDKIDVFRSPLNRPPPRRSPQSLEMCFSRRGLCFRVFFGLAKGRSPPDPNLTPCTARPNRAAREEGFAPTAAARSRFGCPPRVFFGSAR